MAVRAPNKVIPGLTVTPVGQYGTSTPPSHASASPAATGVASGTVATMTAPPLEQAAPAQQNQPPTLSQLMAQNPALAIYDQQAKDVESDTATALNTFDVGANEQRDALNRANQIAARAAMAQSAASGYGAFNAASAAQTGHQQSAAMDALRRLGIDLNAQRQGILDRKALRLQDIGTGRANAVENELNRYHETQLQAAELEGQSPPLEKQWLKDENNAITRRREFASWFKKPSNGGRQLSASEVADVDAFIKEYYMSHNGALPNKTQIKEHLYGKSSGASTGSSGSSGGQVGTPVYTPGDAGFSGF